MRLVFLLILLLGMGLAGFAGYLILQEFGGYDNRVAALQAEIDDLKTRVVETTPVVVAAREISYGNRLTEEDVKEVYFPADAVPENSFVGIDALLGETQDQKDAGRVVTRLIEAGEVMMQTKVSDFGLASAIGTSFGTGMKFPIKWTAPEALEEPS